MRLASLALKHWHALEGYAVAHGQPLALPNLSVARFCSYVWWWATRNAEKEQDIRNFEAQLWRPPAGEVVPAQSPWSSESETSAFAALKQALGK